MRVNVCQRVSTVVRGEGRREYGGGIGCSCSRISIFLGGSVGWGGMLLGGVFRVLVATVWFGCGLLGGYLVAIDGDWQCYLEILHEGVTPAYPQCTHNTRTMHTGQGS